MIPITVHVPKHRVEDFYIRFGEFLSDTPAPSEALRLGDSIVPAWVVSDDAEVVAQKLWDELSLTGNRLLTYVAREAREGRTKLSADELVTLTGNPNGKSGVAGVLGGIGKAIRRAGLPSYRTPTGGEWHYVWDWDGELYWMTPEVANVLIKASHQRGE